MLENEVMKLAFTFRGGIHIEEHKNTRRCKIEKLTPPLYVSLPMLQHVGVHCTPCVKVGDAVYRGQVIGIVKEGLGCPVHASVSGTVKEIKTLRDINGEKIIHVIIENDGTDTLDPSIQPFPKKLTETTAEEIISVVREAGISGMSGAIYPTYAKIEAALGRVRHLIVNCAECEPYITVNHRLLLENPAAVINGTKILMKALGLRNAEIAIQDNKTDAINRFNELLSGSEMLNVRVVGSKYPQGDERQLIYTLKGIELPADKEPSDVGCVVFNAETCTAVYNAFAYGMPLVDRIVTVDGDCVKSPKNILTPLGTPYIDLINFCGGLRAQPKKLINGGPMMGTAQWDITAPVTKGTTALLLFSEENELRCKQSPTCIRCGRCVEVCPMRLMPNYISYFAHLRQYDNSEAFGIMDCNECGACAYSCPAQMPLVELIRETKKAIAAKATAQTEIPVEAEETVEAEEILVAAAAPEAAEITKAEDTLEGEAIVEAESSCTADDAAQADEIVKTDDIIGTDDTVEVENAVQAEEATATEDAVKEGEEAV